MPTHRYNWTPARHAVYQHFVDVRGGPHGEGVSPGILMKDMGSGIVDKNNFTTYVLQSYLQRDRKGKLKKRRYDAQRNALAFAASLVAPPGPTSAQPQVAAGAETPRAGASRAPGNHEARGEPPDPETPEDTEPAAAAATTSPSSVPRKKQRVALAQGAEAANDGFASPERASLSSTRAGALATAPRAFVANHRALELTRQAAPEAAKAHEAAQNAAGVIEAPVAPPGPANADDARESADEIVAADVLVTLNETAEPARPLKARNARELQRMKKENDVLKLKVLRSEQGHQHVLRENTRLKGILRENGIPFN